jgi:hypothetical protein
MALRRPTGNRVVRGRACRVGAVAVSIDVPSGTHAGAGVNVAETRRGDAQRALHAARPCGTATWREAHVHRGYGGSLRSHAP